MPFGAFKEKNMKKEKCSQERGTKQQCGRSKIAKRLPTSQKWSQFISFFNPHCHCKGTRPPSALPASAVCASCISCSITPPYAKVIERKGKKNSQLYIRIKNKKKGWRSFIHILSTLKTVFPLHMNARRAVPFLGRKNHFAHSIFLISISFTFVPGVVHTTQHRGQPSKDKGQPRVIRCFFAIVYLSDKKNPRAQKNRDVG